LNLELAENRLDVLTDYALFGFIFYSY